jgi:hypothetical protein
MHAAQQNKQTSLVQHFIVILSMYTCFVATFHVFPRTEEVASRNQTSPSTQERQQQKEECFFPSLQTLHQYPNK